MEQKIKIIKLIKESKNNKKKNLYTDILNSSKKVQDIIKKTKINKNKFYRIQNTKINSEKDKMISFKYDFNDSTKIKPPQLFIPKKTKCNKQTFITFDKIYKKTLKNKPISKYNSKKINNNCSSSIKYINKAYSISKIILSKLDINKDPNFSKIYSMLLDILIIFVQLKSDKTKFFELYDILNNSLKSKLVSEYEEYALKMQLLIIKIISNTY